MGSMIMLPIVATNSVPVAAFAPAVIVWFGVGMTSKVVLVGFVTCFTALTNQLQGFRRCDQGAVDLLRSLGASERRIFWALRFPAALPYLFTALRVGSVRSVIIAIVAEMLGAYRGVGWIIFETTSSMDYLRHGPARSWKANPEIADVRLTIGGWGRRTNNPRDRLFSSS